MKQMCDKDKKVESLIRYEVKKHKQDFSQIGFFLIETIQQI